MKGHDSALYAQLFPLGPTKSQRTQVQIVEAAIRCYVREGIERATYERIAEASKLSRTLVMRYFPKREDLFDLVVQFIRAGLQGFIVKAIQNEMDGVERLKAYILANFDWAEKNPEHAKVWLVFYHYCSVRAEYRKLNTQLVAMGQERIAALLEQGREGGVFRFKGDVRSRAKMLQMLITGALLSTLTEDLSMNRQVLRRRVLESCLSWVQ